MPENIKTQIRAYGKLQCIDDDLEIMGDYNSYSVQHLAIQWVACDIEAEPDKCRSMPEIKEFMKRKFILTLENSSRFQLNEYNQSKIA